jgi:predicted transcriptional regulator
MSIRKICQRDVCVAHIDESIQDAAQRMLDQDVGSLVVLDEEKTPVGILTDRDIAMRIVCEARNPKVAMVKDTMTSHPVTVPMSTSTEDALKRMRVLGVRRLVVVDGEGRLSGIVALDDILAQQVEEMALIGGILEITSPSGSIMI